MEEASPPSPQYGNLEWQQAIVFQDASFVDLDFLNDPSWMEGLEDVTTETQMYN